MGARLSICSTVTGRLDRAGALHYCFRMKMRPSPDTIERLTSIVGAANAIVEPEAQKRYLVEWRDLFRGATPLVLRPNTTAEVSAIMAVAAETVTPIVVQSGNTGLVGGQIPSPDGGEVVVNLERMASIREIDGANNTLTAEAGCILADVQAAAETADRLFPLSLAAEGSCRIGGNVATNAGGLNVLAYGNMRNLVLGLEVVLADGRIWDGLRTLRKDNTGYDLKQLFIGSEGTLGIVTAAVLRLFPKPRDRATVLAGLATAQDALSLLELAQSMAGGELVACELMPRIGIEFTMRHAGTRDPFTAPHHWYVLFEIHGPDMPGRADERAREILETALARGIVEDATLATSEGQRAALWRLREALTEVQKFEGGSIKHDVAVPVSRVPGFLDEASQAATRVIPGARVVAFGHLGDGNIHFNITQPLGAEKAAFLSRWNEMNAAVHAVVIKLGGSISAEHGIGILKRDLMEQIKDPVELAIMRGLKRMLDPKGILNPGKLLPDER